MIGTIHATKTFRTGVQTLWEYKGRWYVTIKNRTYNSTVEIPAGRAPLWAKAMR